MTIILVIKNSVLSYVWITNLLNLDNYIIISQKTITTYIIFTSKSINDILQIQIVTFS